MKLTLSQSLFWSLLCVGTVIAIPSCLPDTVPTPETALGGSDSLLSPVEYVPVNAGLLAGVIDVRATYLLTKFRESGNALQNAENYQIQLTQRVTETQSRLGLFDGEAVAFSELSNQYAELLAVETVIFWLNNPQSAQTKMSIPLNEPIQITETENDEW